jgi:hypothetical protein
MIRRLVAGGGGMQEVQLHMDGRVVGKIVAHHIARATGHVHGPGSHDGSLSLAPVDMNV